MMLFIRQYLNIIIGGVIAFLIALIVIQSYRVNSLKADLAQCASHTVILNSTIESQNEAIKKQGEDSAKQLQQTRQALKEAERIAKVRRNKINALEGLKTIPPKTCDDAVKQAQNLL